MEAHSSTHFCEMEALQFYFAVKYTITMMIF
jgi:hypothetical protein